MKPRYSWFLLYTVSIIITSCIPIQLQRTTPSPWPTVTKHAVTITPTRQESTTTPSSTTAEPENPPPWLIQTATSSPTPMPQPVIGAHFTTLPFGKELVLDVGEGKKIAIQIEEVLQDNQASTILKDQKPPAGLKWIVIKLSMKYLEGPAKNRLQLLQDYCFDLISNGHVLSDNKINVTDPPSPRVSSINVLVGETGTGWLTYYAYQDDFHPVLRMELLGKTYYFGLTDLGEEVIQAADTSIGPRETITFGENGAGYSDKPVSLGTRVSYGSNSMDTRLFLTIERSYRGFQAWKNVSGFWGVHTPIPPGMEYILAFITIQVIGSPEEKVTFSPLSFASISNGERITSPFSFSCLTPCFGPMTVYLGGKGSGWLPLLVRVDDPNPVLLFNDDVYMTLMSDIDQSITAQSLFSPIAIGDATINNLKAETKIKQPSMVEAMSFSPDSSLLASAGDDREIIIWKTDEGSKMVVLDEHKASVKDLDFSPDGAFLASVSHDKEIIIWDTNTWQVHQTFRQEGLGIFSGFLPDGSLITATQEGKVNHWDIQSGQIIGTDKIPKMMHPRCNRSPLQSFDVSQDGQFYAGALGCGYAVIWAPGTGAPLAVDSNNAADMNLWPNTSAVTFMRRGGLVAYGSSYYQTIGQQVDMVDMATGYVVTSLGAASLNIPTLAFSPNGTALFAAIGSVVRVWYQKESSWASDLVLDLKSHEVQITSLEFSQDAIFLASGDYEGNIVIWKVME